MSNEKGRGKRNQPYMNSPLWTAQRAHVLPCYTWTCHFFTALSRAVAGDSHSWSEPTVLVSYVFRHCVSPRASGTQPPFTAIFTQMWVCLFWIWVKEGGLLKHDFNPQFQRCPNSRLRVRSISWGRSMLPLQEGRLCPFSGLLPLTLKSSIIHHYRPVPLLEGTVSFHLIALGDHNPQTGRNKTWRGCPGSMAYHAWRTQS